MQKLPINMRVLPEQKALISRASELVNMDRTTFIMSAACREAENVLLDRRVFMLEEPEFEAFESLISEPLKQDNDLKKLLSEPSPWESAKG
ncbi:MAG: DUF1778 domain-containing protein [Hydrogenovibrio sp.]